MNIWQDSNNTPKVSPCVGHSVESEKDEFYDTLKKKIIDSWNEGDNKGSDKPSS